MHFKYIICEMSANFVLASMCYKVLPWHLPAVRGCCFSILSIQTSISFTFINMSNMQNKIITRHVSNLNSSTQSCFLFLETSDRNQLQSCMSDQGKRLENIRGSHMIGCQCLLARAPYGNHPEALNFQTAIFKFLCHKSSDTDAVSKQGWISLAMWSRQHFKGCDGIPLIPL